MRVAVIGRAEALHKTALAVVRAGHEVCLVVTAKPAPEYTKNIDDFRRLSSDFGAAFMHTARIQDATEIVKALEPIDIAISYNYPGIIPQEFIDIFRLGILNAHGGDLPKYRGNACQAWAILNGEKHIGLCVHKMAGGELDSGDIIARERLPIGPETKITHVHEWMEERIPELFVAALHLLQINPSYILEQQSREPADALRCYPRNPEDGRIEWKATPIEIVRLVNASAKPYSGAFCYLGDQKVTVWEAKVIADEERFRAVPGQVLSVNEHAVVIGCNGGKVALCSLEIDGAPAEPRSIISSIRQRLR